MFRLPRFRHLLQGAALGTVLALSAFAAIVWLVYQTGKSRLPDGAHVDAAVVLGAAAWDKRPSPVFRERINHAIALYQSRRVDKIIFTGGTPKKGYMTEAEVGRRYALKQGIPARDILFENTSRNTYENLSNIRPLLHHHDIRTIVIVSDPYHLARAAAIADELNLNARVSGTPTSRYDEGKKKDRFLLQESYALSAYYAAYWGNRLWRFVSGNR
ncbi:YdcF family protein [Neisseria lisongii]|uniref:YdcF family protein n=1 Tax=Neisseria lisongii TaxID=2912188 RepID=A0AAW5AKY9_9NEIS|nr:YdcF family protein [Neisseria lisongii]MCF7530527.1 YdcF family protein [Neisseria lisongii]